MSRRTLRVFSLCALVALATWSLLSCSTSDSSSPAPTETPQGTTAPPRITGIQPSVACTTASSILTIFGQNLVVTPVPTVTIGGVPATVISTGLFVNDTTGESVEGIQVRINNLPGTIPANGLAVDITITSEGGTITSVGGALLIPGCNRRPVPIEVNPTTGDPVGGEEVRIRGDALACVTDVAFVSTTDGTQLPALIDRVISDSEIIVVTPANVTLDMGTFDIVTTSACGTGSLPDAFVFGGSTDDTAPDARAINPDEGPASGGNRVTITGDRLGTVTQIQIGSLVIGPSSLDEPGGFIFDGVNLIIPSMPPNPAGIVGPDTTFAIVVTDGTTADGTPVFYDYRSEAVPQCSLIAPDSGSQAGGTQVTITSDITDLSSVDGVLFGGVPAETVLHPTPMQLGVVAPAYLVAAEVEIQLTVRGEPVRDPITNEPVICGTFIYISEDTTPPFSVESITPMVGGQNGEDQVSIRGTGLSVVDRIEICGVRATIDDATRSEEQVRAVTGPFEGIVPAVCDVVVSTADGLSATLPMAFTYQPVVPDGMEFIDGASTAPEAGGLNFRIQGVDLIGVMDVSFSGSQGASGQALACDVQVQGDTEVTGIAPSYFTDGGPFPAQVGVFPVSAGGVDSTEVVDQATGQLFTYFANPELTSAVGAGGVFVNGTPLVTAGEEITVRGLNFMPRDDNFVGSVSISNAGDLGGAEPMTENFEVGFTVVNNNELRFLFPTVLTDDFYDITIRTPRPELTCVDDYSFTLLRALLVGEAAGASSVSPTRGTFLGGTTLTIRGDFAIPPTEVRMAGETYVPEIASETEISIVTQARDEALAGTPEDIIIENRFGSSVLGGAFTFIPRPDPLGVSTVTAACGTASVRPVPVSSGQIVTVTGGDLEFVNVVRINGTDAVVASATDTMLTFQVPAGEVALISAIETVVDFTAFGGTDSELVGNLLSAVQYQEAPTASGIEPPEGRDGTPIVISGTNLFNTDGTPVTATFDLDGFQVNAQAFPAGDGTSLTVIAPDEATFEGQSPLVFVDTCQGRTVAGSYTYLCNPANPTSFSPDEGNQGDVVTILGTSLESADGSLETVMFGDVVASIDSLASDPTMLVVNVPAGNPGDVVSITLLTCGSETPINVGSFRYDCASPAILDIGPTIGTAGTQVVLTGVNLAGPVPPVAEVTFGGFGAAIVDSAEDGSSLTVTAPSGPTGSVVVELENCGTTGPIAAPQNFVYCVAPVVTNMTPVTGAVGSRVAIIGSNLLNGDGSAPTVTFNDVEATIITGTSTATQLDVLVPEGTGNVAVSLVTCGGRVTVGSFLYCTRPDVTELSPLSGAAGSLITIVGMNLVGEDLVSPTVLFDDGVTAPVSVPPLSTDPLIVQAPAGIGAGGIPVQIAVTSCGGTDTALWQYCDVPRIETADMNMDGDPDGVIPTGGPAGTVVRITGENLVGVDGADSVVEFGSQLATILDSAPDAILVEAPEGVPSGSAVRVRVTTCGGVSTDVIDFTYQSVAACPTEPFINGVPPIEPTSGPAGTTVTIRGAGLVGDDATNPTVFFGVFEATLISATDTELIVTTPAGVPNDTTVTVTVQTCGGDDIELNAFTYQEVVGCPDAPAFAAINPVDPISGPADTVVTITGMNLVGDDGEATEVRFGVTPATIVDATDTTLVVLAPAGIPDLTTVSLTVTTCGGSVVMDGAFSFSDVIPCPDAPVLTAFDPPAGPAGTVVSITGMNLVGDDGNAAVVRFGVNVATIIDANDTLITVSVPGDVPDGTEVSVSVETCGGFDSEVPPNGFTYQDVVSCPDAPTLDLVTPVVPDAGPAGTTVTVNGLNLIGADGIAASVLFGTQPATVLDSTATTLLVEVPSGFPVDAVVSVSVTTCGGTDQVPAAYTFAASTPCPDAPAFAAVNPILPISGPADTVVTITGNFFIGADDVAATVFFGTSQATLLDATDTQLLVLAPEGFPDDTTVSVTVTTCGGSDSEMAGFTFDNVVGCPDAPTITMVAPTSGPASTVVTIDGTFLIGGDSNPAVVRFGLTEATVIDATPTQLLVQAPGGFPDDTLVSVTVETCGGSFSSPGAFTFDTVVGCPDMPMLDAVTPVAPISGPADTVVTITGNFLIGGDDLPASVFFGLTEATVIDATPTQLLVRVPGGFPDDTLVSVTVTTCGGSDSVANGFTFDTVVGCPDPPTFDAVTPVTPISGPADTVVTITGTFLIGGDDLPAQVFFGLTEAVVIDATPTQLLVRVPGGFPDDTLVSVTVTTCGGSDSVANGFTFDTVVGCPDAPMLDAVTPVTPISGPADTVVTIAGNFLIGGDDLPAQVFFGLTEAVVIDATPTQLLVRVPGGFPDDTLVSVTVTTCGGSDSVANGFTFDTVVGCPDAPMLDAVTPVAPTSGPADTVVTITGTFLIGGDSNPAQVFFGLTEATVIDATANTILVQAPTGIPVGTNVSVTVTTCGGSDTAAAAFTYNEVAGCANPPTITGVTPGSGPESTVVAIDGTFLIGEDGNNAVVRFGVFPATILDATATQILVQAPGGIPDGTEVSVSVETCAGSFSDPAFTFTYNAVAGCANPPTITGVTPTSGPQSTVVTVDGTFLIGEDGNNAVVRFGVFEATILDATATQILALAPGGIPEGTEVSVSVETCAGSFVDPAFTFTYNAVAGCATAPTLDAASLTPAMGDVGTVVNLTGMNLIGEDGNNAVVRFGLTQATLLDITATSVTFLAPDGGVPNGTAVSVSVETCGGTAVSDTDFTYVGGCPTGPGMPTAMPATAAVGALVEVTGTDLVGGDGVAGTVFFGGVQATLVSSIDAAGVDTLTVNVPAGHAAGTAVDLIVVTCFGPSAAGAFTYAAECPDAPMLDAGTPIDPTMGPAGTLVTLLGTDLFGADGNAGTVFFDGVPATQVSAIDNAGNDTITVQAPMGFDPGTVVDVTVVTCGGTDTEVNAYTYQDQCPDVPAFAAVTPVTPITGAAGSLVTLSGTDLFGGDGVAGTVFFGGVLAAQVSAIDAVTDTIIVNAPGGFPSGSVVDVTVVTCGGTDTEAGAFTYAADCPDAPMFDGVTPVDPTAGPVGTLVTLLGADLFGADGNAGTVFFDGVPATQISAIDNAGSDTITVQSPAGFDPGTVVDITVVTCGGSATEANVYTYQDQCPDPPVLDVPSAMPITGGAGALVTITGTDLFGGDGNAGTIFFDGVVAAQVSAIDAATDTIIVNAPGGFPSGSVVDITVVTCGGSATEADDFTYTADCPDAPMFDGVTPVDPTAGPAGTLVTLLGTDLFGADGNAGTVFFQGVPATQISAIDNAGNDTITVQAPMGFDPGTMVDVTVVTCGGTATEMNAYTFQDQCPDVPAFAAVTPVTPTTGSAGTLVTLVGTDLFGGDGVAGTIFFGGVVAAQVSAVDGATDTIIVNAPAGFPSGSVVDVTVVTCGGSDNEAAAYTYAADCPDAPMFDAVTPVDPTAGPAGTLVTLLGADLFGADGNAGTVFFDGVPATQISAIDNAGSDIITVQSPAGFDPGTVVDITVVTCGGSAVEANVYTYQDVCPNAPNLDVPSAAPATGGAGSLVTITGTDLFGGDGVAGTIFFDGVVATQVSAVDAATDTIIVNAPGGFPSGTMVDITVVTCGGSDTEADDFTYTAECPDAPMFAAVNPVLPNSGPVGALVTLTGTDLFGADGNAGTIFFGGVPASQVSAIDNAGNDTITVNAPAGFDAGTMVDVTVVTCGGTATEANGYQYEEACPTAPDVDDMGTPGAMPATGPAGTVVTITGMGFAGADGNPPTVRFGAVAATLLDFVDTQIIATAPAGVPDGTLVSITVTTCGGSETEANLFTYAASEACVNAAAISAVTPTSGPVGTNVSVRGMNLFGDDGNAGTVFFGSIPATTVTATPDFPVAGTDTIVVTSPAGFNTGDMVDIIVSTCEGPSAAFGTQYEYTADCPTAPAITEVTNLADMSANPAVGSAGDVVEITGTGFAGADGNPPTVTFGTFAAVVVDFTDAVIQAQAPAGVPVGTTVSITVTTCGGTDTEVGSGTSGFMYDQLFDVTGIAPASGPRTGGQIVIISGTGLGGVDSVTICDVAATAVTAISDTTVQATTAAFDGPAPSLCDVVVADTTPVPDDTDTLTMGYTYNALLPNATGFDASSTRSAPAAGGTSFRLDGTQMLDTNVVSFGGEVGDPEGCDVQAETETSIAGTVPAFNSPGGPFPANVDIFVSSAAGTDPTGVSDFEYIANPVLSGATVAGGFATVDVTGANLIHTFMGVETAHVDGGVDLTCVSQLELDDMGMATGNRVACDPPRDVSVPMSGLTQGAPDTFSIPVPATAVCGDVYSITIKTPNTGSSCTNDYSNTLGGAFLFDNMTAPCP